MAPLPRNAFAYARVAAPLLAGLAIAGAQLAPWLLAGATVAACLTRSPLATIIARAIKSEPIPKDAIAFAGLGALATAALSFAGFSSARAAAGVATPVLLVGALALLVSLTNLEGPGVLDAIRYAAHTEREKYLLEDVPGRMRSPADSFEREQARLDVDRRAQGAAVGVVFSIAIEVSASVFLAGAHLAVALAAGAPPEIAWQGAGAFALALASTTAGLAGAASEEGGSPFTNLGAPLLIAFILCAVAVSQDWTITLIGAPMVLLSVLLVSVRPSRFPRAVDVVLSIAIAATAFAVATAKP